MARVEKEPKEKKQAEYYYAPDLHVLAEKLIKSQDSVSHIDVNEVIFLWEIETMPNASAKCFNLTSHPMQLFTDARFCIVFYKSNIDHFTYDQKAILMLHELNHIPAIGSKLIDHDIKDFHEVLQLGVDWNQPGAKVPKLIEGEDEEESKESK
jgi:predicted metallopeptidase